MENQEQQSLGLFELQFDEDAKSSVKTPWATWAMVIVITSCRLCLAICKILQAKK